jgi:hypothetical protein
MDFSGLFGLAEGCDANIRAAIKNLRNNEIASVRVKPGQLAIADDETIPSCV